MSINELPLEVDKSTDDATIDHLVKTAKSIIETKLKDKPVLLLARLGTEMGKDGVEVKRKFGTLTDFAAKYLVDEYVLKEIKSGNRSVRALARPDNSDSEYVKDSRSVEDEQKEFRYNKRFWAAFSVPLYNKIRLISLDTLYFNDTSEGIEIAPGTAIITPSYIADEDEAERKTLIVSNIEKWLKDQGLSRERFGVKGVHEKRESLDTKFSGETSLLDGLLSALDTRQLREISLPLDVIAKLLTVKLPG